MVFGYFIEFRSKIFFGRLKRKANSEEEKNCTANQRGFGWQQVLWGRNLRTGVCVVRCKEKDKEKKVEEYFAAKGKYKNKIDR